ncbi:NAD-dependent epimerase/dehydratase family protein [Mariniblastus fucicola]|uniref:3 beta-hydroxysteroid dehydrogenase/Delta 5-->4-isomerase n=1 Tax=Mariniblastus fucicola TaxID=980251 RepID=A0A5B9PFS1_9BACT|nr:NAD-dependent epimerase/dehydratase family protein [Mariniblastus fucicola]QEG21801.1 3 beta-hydroxysteroid dehydrogenase/Delta 5-->4-isomerase [Mariniblastus fucicola]
MKILVTGATGFLGNNLARKMLQQGHEIVTTVRATSDLRPLDGIDVEVIHADLTDPNAMAPVVEDVELIVHCAAMIQIGHSKRESCTAFNVGSTKLLAEAARRREIRMINVSTVDTMAAATDGVPVTENSADGPKYDCSYVFSKRAAASAFMEEVEKGLDGVTVCPGFMLGPNDWKPSSGEMLLFVAKTPLFFVAAGGCSVVDVRDVADGIMLAIKHGKTGEKYILAGENISYMELWKRMAKIVGCWPPRRKVSNFVAGLAGRTGDLISKFTKEELALNSATITMGQMLNWYSSEKAINELGYSIGEIDIAIEDAWKWFKLHDYA